MSEQEKEDIQNTSDSPKDSAGVKIVSRYKERMTLGFSLFFIFFVFYMWVAIINTPAYKDFAAIPFAGMPLGMFLSLAIFPFSLVIIIFYFLKWR